MKRSKRAQDASRGAQTGNTPGHIAAVATMKPRRHLPALALAGAATALAGLASAPADATPIASLANLTTVRVYEQTGAVTPWDFIFNGSLIQNRRSGNLSSANRDFPGASNEHYDIFYSDSDGSFNALGEYITIEATFVSDVGGGLNINAVELLFSGGAPSEFANQLGSFVSGGNWAFPGTAGNAVDGSTATTTSLGSTSATDRLRLTVGFASSVSAGSTTDVPEPASIALLCSGLAGLGAWSRRRHQSR